MNYTSIDKKYSTNSSLNLTFYEIWTKTYKAKLLIPEANMTTILKHSPRHYPIDLYEDLLPRRFKADFLILPNIIVEIQGGTFMFKSRHNTGTGLSSSFEKLNIYSLLGYQVFQLDSKMITKDWILRIGDSLNFKTI